MGTTAPDVELHVHDAGGLSRIKLTGTASNADNFEFGQGTTGVANSGFEIRDVDASATRLVIDSSGNILIGTTTTNIATEGTVIYGFGNEGVMQLSSTNMTALYINRNNTGTLVDFRLANSTVGTISTNANSLPSDKNFKRDITDLDLGLNLVSKLKPSQYNYKIDDEDCPKMYGLLAQDLEESLTEVGIEKNSTWLLQHSPKEDEKESDYSLDYVKLIPILINSIKELETRIKDLER